MEYSDVINEIHNRNDLKEIIKKSINYNSDDFEISKSSSADLDSDDENIIYVEFIGGYQDKLLELKLFLNDNKIESLRVESSEDLAEKQVKTDKLNFDIDYWSYNITYDQLSRMMKDGKIKIPNMQRGFVWDKVQASKLIESIFMGLPLPSLFLIKQDDGKYLIVDGLQRITTISNFKYNEALPGTTNKNKGFSLLGVNANLIGKNYNDLVNDENPNVDLDKFDMGTINVIEFKQNKPEYEEAMYSLFERLNSGGTNLTPQQIRNSIYYGTFNDKLNKFSERLNKYFSKKAISGLAPSEIILRTLSIVHFVKENKLLEKKYDDISGSIVYKKLLNENAEKYHMEYKKIERLDSDEVNKNKQQSIFDESIENELNNVDNAIKQVEQIFKENSFKRYENEEYKKRISPILFESIISTILLNSQHKMLPENEVINNYINIFKTDEYENYFTQGTGKLKNIYKRIEIMKKSLING